LPSDTPVPRNSAVSLGSGCPEQTSPRNDGTHVYLDASSAEYTHLYDLKD